MDNSVFRFKKFEVSHGSSSMKVGVDAVLLGAWSLKEGAESILDVGTGCGVIALILSQRYPAARIMAVDVDEASIEEAKMNFNNSIFAGSLQAEVMEFPYDVMNMGQKFDLIVSNPPFFNSGVKTPVTRREKARHQASLSVHSLLDYSDSLLTERGVLAMIFPYEFRDEVVDYGKEKGLALIRKCDVRDNLNRPFKRVMLEFGRTGDGHSASILRQQLVLFKTGSREPTEEYRELCRDLYLKF